MSLGTVLLVVFQTATRILFPHTKLAGLALCRDVNESHVEITSCCLHSEASSWACPEVAEGAALSVRGQAVGPVGSDGPSPLFQGNWLSGHLAWKEGAEQATSQPPVAPAAQFTDLSLAKTQANKAASRR